jgi:hypothetical protein
LAFRVWRSVPGDVGDKKLEQARERDTLFA